MSNQIDAYIEFSYQGKTYRPSARIDLDRLMESAGHEHNIHLQLAQLNGIDSYSYLYEVMESCPISFSNPSGFAADFLSDSGFDFTGFEAHWREARDFSTLDDIMERHLKGHECARHPGLKTALRDAFRAGKAAADRE